MELMWASISLTWSAGTAERTSSAYLFQNMVGTGTLRARSSICSITMFATTILTPVSPLLFQRPAGTVYSPVVVKGGE